MSKKAAELKALVLAVNKAHAYANDLYKRLRPIFEPLVGETILKMDNSLLAKYEKLLPAMPYGNGLHVFRDRSEYSLVWTVKTDEDIEGFCGCLYYEIGVYVGFVKSRVLDRIADSDERRTDYTIEEIEAKRQKTEEAKAAYEQAKSDCWPFGER